MKRCLQKGQSPLWVDPVTPECLPLHKSRKLEDTDLDVHRMKASKVATWTGKPAACRATEMQPSKTRGNRGRPPAVAVLVNDDMPPRGLLSGERMTSLQFSTSVSDQSEASVEKPAQGNDAIPSGNGRMVGIAAESEHTAAPGKASISDLLLFITCSQQRHKNAESSKVPRRSSSIAAVLFRRANKGAARVAPVMDSEISSKMHLSTSVTATLGSKPSAVRLKVTSVLSRMGLLSQDATPKFVRVSIDDYAQSTYKITTREIDAMEAEWQELLAQDLEDTDGDASDDYSLYSMAPRSFKPATGKVKLIDSSDFEMLQLAAGLPFSGACALKS